MLGKIFIYLNSYPFIIYFFCISFVFIISIAFSVNVLYKKIFLIISAVFIVLSIYEVYLSFNMSPIYTKPVEIYNKRKSYFPIKGEQYQVSEILLNNNKRKCFLIKDNYNSEKNNFIGKNRLIFEAIYTIDENGLRYTKSNVNANESYLFLGCSFAFGACVNDDQTLPYYFSEKLNFDKKVINGGQDAKGINRALSFLKNDFFADIIKGSDLREGFYIYNNDHIARAFRYRIPFDNIIYENGKEYEIDQPFKLIKKVFTRSLIYDRLFSNFIEIYSHRFYLDKTKEHLLDMNNIVKNKYGSNLIIVMWNHHEDLEKFFEENNIDFFNVYKYLDLKEDIIKEDGHPSSSAHKKTANLLIEYLKNKGEL